MLWLEAEETSWQELNCVKPSSQFPDNDALQFLLFHWILPGEWVLPRTPCRAGEQEFLTAAALGVGSLLCGTIAIWEWFCLINNQSTLPAAFSFTKKVGWGKESERTDGLTLWWGLNVVADKWHRHFSCLWRRMSFSFLCVCLCRMVLHSEHTGEGVLVQEWSSWAAKLRWLEVNAGFIVMLEQQLAAKLYKERYCNFITRKWIGYKIKCK